MTSSLLPSPHPGRVGPQDMKALQPRSQYHSPSEAEKGGGEGGPDLAKA